MDIFMDPRKICGYGCRRGISYSWQRWKIISEEPHSHFARNCRSRIL